MRPVHFKTTKTALCSGRDFPCWSHSGTQVSQWWNGKLSVSFCIAVSVSFQEKMVALLLSGIWDLRAHIIVKCCIYKRSISLVCFGEKHTFQRGVQNSKESVWKNTWLIF